MYIQTKSEDSVRTSMSILQFLLKNYRPRDFAVRLWDGSTWDPEPGQPARFTMVIRHPAALRNMFLGAGERQFGEAYIYNDFDIEGHFEGALPMAEHLFGLHLGIADRIRLGRQLRRLPPNHVPRAGRQAARLRGAVHSIERDRQAVENQCFQSV